MAQRNKCERCLPQHVRTTVKCTWVKNAAMKTPRGKIHRNIPVQFIYNTQTGFLYERFWQCYIYNYMPGKHPSPHVTAFVTNLLHGTTKNIIKLKTKVF